MLEEKEEKNGKKRRKEPRFDTSALDTYGGKSEELTPEYCMKLVNNGRTFNDSINLYSTVKTNENFFIGKQWEGVNSNGLPTPVFNVLKRVVTFTAASINSENMVADVNPMQFTPNTAQLAKKAQILKDELNALIEYNNMPSLVSEFTRNAAVDGDGCIYTYWDADAETGGDYKGCIRSEIVENTRVIFGNPTDRKVQKQPYIIICKRAMRGDVVNRAKENGFEDYESIGTTEAYEHTDSVKRTDDKVDLFLLLWKDRKTKEVCAYEFTEKCGVRNPWSLGIRMYPIIWLNWDYVQDCYHGEAMMTGLIPNQIFINRGWAFAMLSMMTTAVPKILYDKTRIARWDNRVGSAIGMSGNVDGAAKIMEGASISPQISQFLAAAVEQTESSLGATSVALGDTRPDNTSAIIALQRAASTPSERTKQNIHESVEEWLQICCEFIAEYYGTRDVDQETPEEMKAMFQWTGQSVPPTIAMPFDFGEFKKLKMVMKLDVGASTYYSEIASIQTLDNLLRLGQITVVQYLDRVPDGYVPKRQELIEELKRKEEEQRQMEMMQMGIQPGMMGGGEQPPPEAVSPSEEAVAEQTEKKADVHGGGGYSDLQRKINAGIEV